MKRLILRVLPVAVIALSLAGAAQAQSRSWTVCGGNHFNTCASVDVVVSGASVTMRLWNLSGFYGSYANTIFTSVGFEGVGSAAAVTNSLSMSGPVRGTDTPSQWQLRNNTMVGGGVNLDMVASTQSGLGDGIASNCATPGGLPGGTTELWQNPCSAPTGPTDAGWIVVNFSITGTWDLDNTYLLVKGQNGPNGASTQCITGGSNENCFDVPTNVVPEPVTIALLATGLAGVGGAGALKRRRRNDFDAAEG